MGDAGQSGGKKSGDPKIGEVKPKGDEASVEQTNFQNFDQKTNQMFNILSTILKNLNEMSGLGGLGKSINQ